MEIDDLEAKAADVTQSSATCFSKKKKKFIVVKLRRKNFAALFFLFDAHT